MSRHHNPRIVTDGLVLYLDAANKKSYPYHPDTMDHGISDWYCFVNATITYSIIYPDTTIYQKDTNGSVTEVLSASTPQRGTFAATAGYKYWGSKGIFLSDEGQQHYVVPMTAAGTSFVWYASRNVSPGQIYVYSPFADATVNYFNGTANGINDTPTTTITVNKGTQSTALQYTNTGYHYISSNYPIVASIGGSADTDNTPLNPAETVVYNRYPGYIRTVINTAPTDATYSFYSSEPTMSHTIGDGSGGNCAQGLGKSYISDTYSFGNVLSDYTIVCPNNNTIVASYWNGSQWIVWDTHVLSGTELSAVRATRDGTNGPGVESSSIAGTSTNMASGATLWKWEGTDKFFIGINDSLDDEMSLYGWMSDNAERKESIQDAEISLYDLSLSKSILNKNNTSFISIEDNSFKFSRSSGTPKLGGSISILGTGSLTSSNFLYGDHSWDILFRIDDRYPGMYDANEAWSTLCCYRGYHAGFIYTSSILAYYLWNSTSGIQVGTFSVGTSGTEIIQGQWAHICATKNSSGVKLYLNGQLSKTYSGTFTINSGISNDIRFGAAQTNTGLSYSYFSKSTIAESKMYNKELSANEVKQNFNALRGRYGL